MVSDRIKLRYQGTLRDSALFRPGLWLWLGFCLLPLTCATAQANALTNGNELSLLPAWQGYLKSGSGGSEMAVRFLAPHNGRARLTLLGSRARVSRDFQFEPGRAVALNLPPVHDRLEPVTVELQLEGESIARQQVKLTLLPASARLVAIVTGAGVSEEFAPEFDAGENTLLYLAPDELPGLGLSYSQLSALVLSDSALQALNPRQRQALGEYLGACGTLYLTASAGATAASLQDAAGCGGSNIFAAVPGGEQRWLPGAAAALPGVASLRTLFPGADTGVARSLLIFLVGYLGLLLLAARTATSALPLLLLPPLATGMALLAWTMSSPLLRVSSWAEMDSGDPVLRFAGLLQVTGTSRRQLPLNLPAQLGLPQQAEGLERMELYYGPGAEPVRLSLETRLLSQHEFLFRGTAPGVRVEVIAGADMVVVTNRGEGPTEPGLLAWRGQRFSVPGLAAGQGWRPPAQAEPWGNTPQEQLLRQRAVGGGSWLLLPVAIPALLPLANEQSATSWLLVKGAGDA